MPLIDAFIKCGNFDGSYKATEAILSSGGVRADLERSHDGWSELSSFSYSVGISGHPVISISKIVDAASTKLFERFLQLNSRAQNKGSKIEDLLIDQITIELCRWVDSNDDGVKDLLLVFLSYVFTKCRLRDYSNSIGSEADDFPDESFSFDFRNMEMHYYYIVRKKDADDNDTVTQEHTSFACDFEDFNLREPPHEPNDPNKRFSKAGEDLVSALNQLGRGRGGGGDSNGPPNANKPGQRHGNR